MRKIFISSTFRDMQAERDEIQKNIVPYLRNLAREYGEDVEVCDLRWGVNTGDLDGKDGSKKVLSVCLDEIDKCKPYMVVMLGERYGWIPDSELLCSAAKRKNYELDELEKSVTALEIEYGALNDKTALNRCIFMFREPLPEADKDYQSESAKCAEKLKALKNRIRNLAGDRVFTYHVKWDLESGRLVGLEEFSDIVKEQLVIFLTSEWEEYAALSEREKENRRCWNLIENKAAQFKGRELLLQECKEKLKKGNHRLILGGGAGSGKSTICCKLMLDYRENGWKVCPFLGGSDGKSSSVMDILRQWVFFLEDWLAENNVSQLMGQWNHLLSSTGQVMTEEAWQKRFNMLLLQYVRTYHKPILFVVDGLEHIEAGTMTRYFGFLPNFQNPKLHILLSCSEDYDTEFFEGEKAVVPALNLQEKEEVIKGMLASHSKELDRSVMAEVMKKEDSDQPFYLSLMMQRLLMFDQEDFDVIAAYGNDMTAISAYQKKVIQAAPENEMELCEYLIQEITKGDNAGFVRSMIEFIAVSQGGLREHDLEKLMEKEQVPWSSLEFSRIINLVSRLFVEKNGKIDLSSKHMKQAIQSRLDMDAMNRKIFSYIMDLPTGDDLKSDEMVPYCYLLHEEKALMDYLSECVKAARKERKNEHLVKKAAYEVTKICVQDEGKWYCQALVKEKDPDHILCLNDFMSKWLLEELLYSSQINGQIALKLMNVLLRVDKEQIETENKEVFLHMCASLCNQIYQIYMGLKEDHKALLAAIDMEKYAKQLCDISENRENQYVCAVSHVRKAEIFAKLKNLEAYNEYMEAEKRFIKLMQEEEDEVIAWDIVEVWMGKAAVLEDTGCLKEAYDIYIQTIGLCRQIQESAGRESTDRDRRKVIGVWNKICKNLCKQGKFPEAKDVAYRVVFLEQNWFELQKTPENAKKYAGALKQFAEISDQLDCLDEAVEAYQKWFILLKWIYEQTYDTESFEEYEKACQLMGLTS